MSTKSSPWIVVLSAIGLCALLSIGPPPAHAAMSWIVDQGGGGDFTTIQAAINAATSGDTIIVHPGTYNENLTLSKSLTFQGPMVGADARLWATAPANDTVEAVLTAASGTILTLQGGSANTVVDGFRFVNAATSIQSTSGPIDGIQIVHNGFEGFTGSCLFLNDSGTDITVDRNLFDASSKTGAGGTVHLDTDAFDGFWFTNNWVINDANGTGFFCDGNRNVGSSPGRSPLFQGNHMADDETGTNIGRKAFEYATFRQNGFLRSGYDGLQGGPAHTVIEKNRFADNGRYGLALTGFGGSGDTTRGAQFNTVKANDFEGNGFVQTGAGLLFSSGQYPGTISTNTANGNNVVGNLVGATFPGGLTPEVIDATGNWWGDATGPFHAIRNTGGAGNSVVDGDGTTGGLIDFDPWATQLQSSVDPVTVTCPANVTMTCISMPTLVTLQFTYGANPDTTVGWKILVDSVQQDSGRVDGPFPRTVTFSYTYAPGLHTVDFQAIDETTEVTGQCSVTVDLQTDTTPPTVTCSVGRPILWPPFFGMIPVSPAATITDDCDPAPTMTMSVYSNEPVGSLTPDALWDGTNLMLRAERQWPGTGRIYLIVFTGTDATGNTANTCCHVIVPATLTVSNLMFLQAQASAANCSTLPPPGFPYQILAPVPFP